MVDLLLVTVLCYISRVGCACFNRLKIKFFSPHLSLVLPYLFPRHSRRFPSTPFERNKRQYKAVLFAGAGIRNIQFSHERKCYQNKGLYFSLQYRRDIRREFNNKLPLNEVLHPIRSPCESEILLLHVWAIITKPCHTLLIT